MAHPAVVAYLRAHQDRFPLERLRQQLSQQGYPEAVIAAGVAAVYGARGVAAASPRPAAPRSVFDWRTRTVYRTGGQRVGHFLAGLLLGWGLSVGFFLLDEVFSSDAFMMGVIALLALRVALLVLFFWRRPWLGWGLLAATLLSQRVELQFFLSLIFGGWYRPYRYSW